MNATQLVRNTLAILDGKVFESREDIDDAVFPLFGPLQPLFTGEGHRDLVDKLMSARWIILDGDKWRIKLPTLVETKEPPIPPPLPPSAISSSPAKNDAISAILVDDYKKAIQILTTLI